MLMKAVDFYNDPVVLRWDCAQNKRSWALNCQALLRSRGECYTHYVHMRYSTDTGMVYLDGQGDGLPMSVPMIRLVGVLCAMNVRGVKLKNPTMPKKSTEIWGRSIYD